MFALRWSGRLAALLGVVAAGATGCGVADPAPARPLTGVAVLQEAAAMPPEAELVVQFRAYDGSEPVEDRAVAEGRQPPLHFRLWIPAGRGGRVDVAVIDGDTRWEAEPLAVSLLQGPVDLGTITLARATPAAGITVQREPEAEPEWTPAAAAEAVAAPPEPEVEAGIAAAPPEFEVEPGIAAAAPEPEVEAGIAAAPERLRCGASEIAVVADARSARLTVGTVEVDLVAVDGAAGRRYEVPGDPETFFAAAPGAPVVSFAGERLPPCEVIE
jgi:hypothetical protein